MKGEWETWAVYEEQADLTRQGAWFRVYYSYDPGEREVLYYPDGSGHPGSPSSIEIQKITMCVGKNESGDIESILEELMPGFDLMELAERILKEEEAA